MYGLPRCACGDAVFNEDTGKCGDCTHEIAAQEAAERISDLDRALRAHSQMAADLESLLALSNPGSGVPGRRFPGPPGRFQIVTAAELTLGDRLFDDAAAMIGAAWPDPFHVAVTLANGSCRTFDQSHPMLIWRPDDPFTPCHECAQPLFTRCSENCRADRDRQAYLERARSGVRPTRPASRHPGSLEAPCFNGKDVHSCILTPALRSTGADVRDEDIEGTFLRLAPTFRAFPEPVDVAAFDIEVPTGFCSYTEGWDLTIAMSVLLSCKQVAPDRLSSTLFWARVEPDGALTAPEDLDALIAANASDAGYDQLITAEDFTAATARECRLLRFANLSQLLHWANLPELDL